MQALIDALSYILVALVGAGVLVLLADCGAVELKKWTKKRKASHSGRIIPKAKAEAIRAGWDKAAEVLPDGVPCGHPGCLSHVTHPCEGCGGIGGRQPATEAEQVNIGADSGGNHLPEPSAAKVLALIEELVKFTTVERKKNLARLLK